MALAQRGGAQNVALQALLSYPGGAHGLADAAREETTARRSARVRRSSTRRGC
jgi:hypothetical protein